MYLQMFSQCHFSLKLFTTFGVIAEEFINIDVKHSMQSQAGTVPSLILTPGPIATELFVPDMNVLDMISK